MRKWPWDAKGPPLRPLEMSWANQRNIEDWKRQPLSNLMQHILAQTGISSRLCDSDHLDSYSDGCESKADGMGKCVWQHGETAGRREQTLLEPPWASSHCSGLWPNCRILETPTDCACGWGKVTSTLGLKIHQGKKRCLPNRGLALISTSYKVTNQASQMKLPDRTQTKVCRASTPLLPSTLMLRNTHMKCPNAAEKEEWQRSD